MSFETERLLEEKNELIEELSYDSATEELKKIIDKHRERRESWRKYKMERAKFDKKRREDEKRREEENIRRREIRREEIRREDEKRTKKETREIRSITRKRGCTEAFVTIICAVIPILFLYGLGLLLIDSI